MKTKSSLAVYITIALIVPACSGFRPASKSSVPAAGKQGPAIRVLLSEGLSRAEIKTDGALSVRGPGGLSLFHQGEAGSITISREQSSLFIRQEPGGNVSSSDLEVYLIPDRNTLLSVDGITYRGRIEVYPAGNGLQVINVLGLEQYLEGVVPHELGNPGPHGYAALEAQAVAARTYAMSRMRIRQSQPFDVYASVQDQVYQGTKGAFELASSAIEKTRGKVLDYNGELVQAYYCANCGGHTSDIRRVWPNRQPAPYLTGVRDRAAVSKETCCREGRRFRWRYSFSGRELGEIIRRTLPRELDIPANSIGSLRDLRILERSASGRVSAIEIVTDGGIFRVSGDRIRWVFMIDLDRGQILRSTLFDIDKTMDGGTISFVTFSGGGNGHGVGMCQDGAIGMAKSGYTYKMILTHYYPGCRIVSSY
jgi:stage II sporulation protein D